MLPRILGVLLTVAVASALLVLPHEKDTGCIKRRPVEVWCGGDDGLTARLCEAIESAFEKSADFLMSHGKRPGTLVVTIPTNVGWYEIRGRTRAMYTVEFAKADGEAVGRSKGSCWDGELTLCATRIFNEAKRAARQIR
jgi:hypothetical protein